MSKEKKNYIKIHKIDIKKTKFIVFNKTFEDSIVFSYKLSCSFGCFCGFYYFIEYIIIFYWTVGFLTTFYISLRDIYFYYFIVNDLSF